MKKNYFLKLLPFVGLAILLGYFTTSCDDDDDLKSTIQLSLVTKITADSGTEFTFEYNSSYFMTKYTKNDGASVETNTLSYTNKSQISKRVNDIDGAVKTYDYIYSGNKVYEKDVDSGIVVDTLTVNEYTKLLYTGNYSSSPQDYGSNITFEYPSIGLNIPNISKATYYEYQNDSGIKKEYIKTQEYTLGFSEGIYAYFIQLPEWFKKHRLPYGYMWGVSNNIQKIEQEEIYKEDGIEINRIPSTITFEAAFHPWGHPLTISWKEGGDTHKLTMEYEEISYTYN